MSRVEGIKVCFELSIFRRLIVSALSLVATTMGLVSIARAATMDFIDLRARTVYPMYGVPYDPPIVKYGPPPIPTTAPPVTISPPISWSPGFDWNSIWTQPWSFTHPPSMHFTAPTLGQWFPSFPKMLGIATSDLLATLAFVAYLSLLLAAVCGWAFKGGLWYLKNKYKK